MIFRILIITKFI